jgi:3'(2'), 5'-bisphosphate nucleotidase
VDGQPLFDGLADDHELAWRLVAESGRVLRAVHRLSCAGTRRSWAPLVRAVAGDRSAQTVMGRILAEARPDDAVRSEEGPEDPRRPRAGRVWIVDPLDGSDEFGRRDGKEWSTQVALWSDGTLVAGAVSLPVDGRVYAAGIGPGSGAIGSVGSVRSPGTPLRLVVSRQRPPRWIGAVADRLAAVVLVSGSAGVKTAAVLDGWADAYLHDGGQYEWDSAGPVAVARAAGLHATRLDGTELRYNQDDPRLPDLCICQPEIADRVLTAVAVSR